MHMSALSLITWIQRFAVITGSTGLQHPDIRTEASVVKGCVVSVEDDSEVDAEES